MFFGGVGAVPRRIFATETEGTARLASPERLVEKSPGTTHLEVLPRTNDRPIPTERRRNFADVERRIVD